MKKRGREEGEVESLDMAKCLMLLSKVGEMKANTRESGGFKCRTCSREFSSFQALGGHRASHNKKPKLMTMKPKMHGCHICGVEFEIGQALGGHMRKHRAEAVSNGLGKSDREGIDLLSLDLNLTPLENGLKLELRPHLVNCPF